MSEQAPTSLDEWLEHNQFVCGIYAVPDDQVVTLREVVARERAEGYDEGYKDGGFAADAEDDLYETDT